MSPSSRHVGVKSSRISAAKNFLGYWIINRDLPAVGALHCQARLMKQRNNVLILNSMDPIAIRDKFGDNYIADAHTFKMGIDRRFTEHFATRFKNMTVLETCTGAGFSTISLAKYAKK
jgi:hypothetical protein